MHVLSTRNENMHFCCNHADCRVVFRVVYPCNIMFFRQYYAEYAKQCIKESKEKPRKSKNVEFTGRINT